MAGGWMVVVAAFEETKRVYSFPFFLNSCFPAPLLSVCFALIVVQDIKTRMVVV